MLVMLCSTRCAGIKELYLNCGVSVTIMSCCTSSAPLFNPAQKHTVERASWGHFELAVCLHAMSGTSTHQAQCV